MRKRDIVLKIYHDTRIKQVVIKEIVQKTFDAIFEALIKGEKVEIRNFGVFKVKKRKRRVGRNPKTGEVVPIPERQTVIFKPGRAIRKYIK